MAFLVLVIDTPDSIAQINSKEVTQSSTKPHEAIEACQNYLAAILNGSVDASVQITSRDTDPSVATSGSGSRQITANLK